MIKALLIIFAFLVGMWVLSYFVMRLITRGASPEQRKQMFKDWKLAYGALTLFIILNSGVAFYQMWSSP